jgi:chromosome segregation ATPase
MNKKREQQLHQKWQDKQRDKKASNLAGFAAEYMIVDDVWGGNNGSASEEISRLNRKVAALDGKLEVMTSLHTTAVAQAMHEQEQKEKYKAELVETIDDHNKRRAWMEEDLRKAREENIKLKKHIEGLEAALKALTPAPESDDPIERAVQRAEKRNW